MRKYATWGLLLVFLSLMIWLRQSRCTGNKRPAILYTDSTLFFLRAMDGKKWEQTQLFSHPEMYQRLSKLVGQDWSRFQQQWIIEHPIVVYDDILLLRGCDSLDCYARNFILLADVHKNNLHIGIRSGDQIEEHSEDTNYIPTAMHAWKIRKLE